MKPIKIIFDASPLVMPKSGVGFFTHSLISELAVNYPEEVQLVGHYFNFMGRRKQPDDLPRYPNITYVESRLFPARIISLLRKFGLQLPYKFFTRQSGDIFLFPNFVSFPGTGKAKRIVIIYDLSYIDCPEYASEKLRKFLKHWAGPSARSADIVLTISEFTKQRIVDVYGISAQKIHVVQIPPRAPAEPDLGIIKRHGLDQNYLLFVGTIEPRKNIIGLLGAYANLSQELRDKHPLVLAGGKGWNDEEIITKLSELKNAGLNIVQTGYISEADKSSLYQNALLCIQPSHYEGFGMPILEAMSFGKPVACSDISVFHEVAGEAALFFNQNEPKSITAVIEQLLLDPNKRAVLSTKSIERIKSYPTWSIVVSDLYERLKTNP
jgi:glycosyltransferase involved in cell wall biosynthesis